MRGSRCVPLFRNFHFPCLMLVLRDSSLLFFTAPAFRSVLFRQDCFDEPHGKSLQRAAVEVLVYITVVWSGITSIAAFSLEIVHHGFGSSCCVCQLCKRRQSRNPSFRCYECTSELKAALPLSAPVYTISVGEC